LLKCTKVTDITQLFRVNKSMIRCIIRSYENPVSEKTSLEVLGLV